MKGMMSLDALVSLVIHSIIIIALLTVIISIALLFFRNEHASAENELEHFVNLISGTSGQYKTIVVFDDSYSIVGFPKDKNVVDSFGSITFNKPSKCGSKSCICLFYHKDRQSKTSIKCEIISQYEKISHSTNINDIGFIIGVKMSTDIVPPKERNIKVFPSKIISSPKTKTLIVS